MDRFVLHRRFFIPSFLGLLFSFPGSLAVFDLTKLTRYGAVETAVFAVFVFFTVTAYCVVLFSQKQPWAKAIIGLLLHIAVVGLNYARIREGNFRLEDAEAIFELSIFRVYLVFFIFFFVLCYLDTVKRSLITAITVSVACGIFFIQGVRTWDTQGDLDLVLLQDVRERLHITEEWDSSVLAQECLRINGHENRSICMYEVTDKLKLTNCFSEDEAYNSISCFQEAAKHSHPPPQPTHLFEPLKAGIQ